MSTIEALRQYASSPQIAIRSDPLGHVLSQAADELEAAQKRVESLEQDKAKVVPINKEAGTGWTVAYNLIQKIQDRANTHMPDEETVSMEEVEAVILALHNAGYLTMEKLTP